MNLKIPGLTPEEAQWMTLRAAGALLADGEIKDLELKALGQHYDLMSGADPLSALAKETLMRVKPPDQGRLATSPDKALKIFRFVLKILVSDLTLCDKKVAYALHTARLLDLGEKEARPALTEAIELLRLDFFLYLIERLQPDQRLWLAATLIKVIYADGRVTPSERAYLNHLGHLLGDDFAKIEHLRQHHQDYVIEDIDPASFSQALRLKIYRYLVEVALQGQELEPQALTLCEAAGQHLGLTGSERKEILAKTLALLPLL